MVTSVAILIDGGFFLKRLRAIRQDIGSTDAEAVGMAIKQLIKGHLDQLNAVYRVPNPLSLLYRCFYYDAPPSEYKGTRPVSKTPIDYAKTEAAVFRKRLLEILRRQPRMAVRLGVVRPHPGRFWTLRAKSQKLLLSGGLALSALGDEHFVPTFRQKGVDMRIGLDIATLTLKGQAKVIVLVSGDADFVPAAKLARREGVQFILDPMGHNIPPDLVEHIDLLWNGLRPT